MRKHLFGWDNHKISQELGSEYDPGILGHYSLIFVFLFVLNQEEVRNHNKKKFHVSSSFQGFIQGK